MQLLEAISLQFKKKNHNSLFKKKLEKVSNILNSMLNNFITTLYISNSMN